MDAIRSLPEGPIPSGVLLSNSLLPQTGQLHPRAFATQCLIAASNLLQATAPITYGNTLARALHGRGIRTRPAPGVADAIRIRIVFLPPRESRAQDLPPEEGTASLSACLKAAVAMYHNEALREHVVESASKKPSERPGEREEPHGNG